MCECYQVGGRFIAEDPQCPVHGYQAQQAEAQRGTFEQFWEELLQDSDRLADLLEDPEYLAKAAFEAGRDL